MYSDLLRLTMTVYAGRYGIDVTPFAIGALLLGLIALWFKGVRPSRLLCCAVFSIYLLYALEIAFFPLHISGDFVDARRESSYLQEIYLNPFDVGYVDDALTGVLLNTLMTVPFGFGISFVASVRPRQILWIAPAVGLGVEGAQLAISLLLGYTYRFIEANDALMNALGVLLGYGLFLLFARLYLAVAPRLGIPRRGLPSYISIVAADAVRPAPSHREA